MPISSIVEISVAQGNQEMLTRQTLSSEGLDSRDVSIADAATDIEVALVIDISQLAVFFLHADQALTMETNSASVPVQTFTLVADVPMFWQKDSGVLNPFTADVTKVFFTNAVGGLAAGTVKIRVLHDATP